MTRYADAALTAGDVVGPTKGVTSGLRDGRVMSRRGAERDGVECRRSRPSAPGASAVFTRLIGGITTLDSRLGAGPGSIAIVDS